MTLNDIHDELATLRAAVLEGCDLYPATDYGLNERCGSIYCSEDYLVMDTPSGLQRLLTGFTQEPLRIGDLYIYSLDDDQVLRAMQTLEYKHD